LDTDEAASVAAHQAKEAASDTKDKLKAGAESVFSKLKGDS
jgi:hypothetical protein